MKRNGIKTWLRRHRKLIGIVLGVIVGLVIVAQFAYPSSRLLPYVRVDNLEFGGWQKKDAADELNNRYLKQSVALAFGDNKTASLTPLPSDIGLTIDNQARLDSLSYPWYMRLIPSSVLWYGSLHKPTMPEYGHNRTVAEDYVKSTLGSSCDVKPVNASLEVKDKTVKVVSSSMGGTCEPKDVVEALTSAQPDITGDTLVRVALQEIPPVIDDAKAAALADTINQRLEGDKVNIMAGSVTVSISSDEIVSWLTFTNKGAAITIGINTKKSQPVLNKEVAPKVALAAGTTYISTVDFQVVSQKTGANGRTLDVQKTGASIVAYLTGKDKTIKAMTKSIAPRVVYTRKYSKTDTGISALFTNFAKDHPGTYGIQLIELSGQRRRASYNANHKFVTASTYKLFAAYGTLRRIENGSWKWTDNISGGRDAAKCFEDMIVVSDNACAQAFVKKIGHSNLDKELRQIGINDTTFLIENYRTTASDLATFLAALQSNQLPINASSRDRLISAMKRNVYRQGIPAGSNGTVADKVGFLWKLLHDAAIVYSPNGTYVLTVMTDGSSWQNIAELTRKLEKIRS